VRAVTSDPIWGNGDLYDEDSSVNMLEVNKTNDDKHR